MKADIFTHLQLREVFHLEFLRWLARKLDASQYALKGGVNLRLFFQSVRYSEDIDLDTQQTTVSKIQKNVLEILSNKGFSASLQTFGIERVVPPNIASSKQTETTQRFRVHLMTAGGADLFTKIEFSKKVAKDRSVVESVPDRILRPYKMAPFVIPHYPAEAAVRQKIHALAHRAVLQARDIFDLFLLGPQCDRAKLHNIPITKHDLRTAWDNIFLVDHAQFRDAVAAYLSEEDQKSCASVTAWDAIKLKVAHFLEELKNENP